MDLSEIDKVIEALEKKKSLRPGSPPEVINGHLGVWRTVRHNRVFLELTNGGKSLGRVLIGPPSFVGRSLDNIPSEVWAALTPRATLKEFRNLRPSQDGIDTLKQSIVNAVGPKDTRRDAVKDLDTIEQLVPIARSAGFTDDEIKDAARGKSPNSAIQGVKDRRDVTQEVSPPENVTQLRQPEKPNVEQKEDNDVIELEGALARIPQQSKGTKSADDRAKSVADFLDGKIAPKIKNDDLLKQRVQDLANGLRAGKYEVRDVEEEIKEIIKNRSRVKERSLRPVEREALEDSVKIKEFISSFEAKLDEKVQEKIAEDSGKFKARPSGEVSDSRVRELAEQMREEGDARVKEFQQQREEAERARRVAAGERAKAQEFLSDAQRAKLEADAALSLLSDLASTLKNTEIKKEVEYVIKTSRGSANRKSILLRLYQLLQLLLLFIPGL